MGERRIDQQDRLTHRLILLLFVLAVVRKITGKIHEGGTSWSRKSQAFWVLRKYYREIEATK